MEESEEGKGKGKGKEKGHDSFPIIIDHLLLNTRTNTATTLELVSNPK